MLQSVMLALYAVFMILIAFVLTRIVTPTMTWVQILMVKGGEIVEIGPHDELMARKGFYYALYMSQFKGKLPTDSSADVVDFVST